MGLEGELRGIVPAQVTYAEARKVWAFGVACAEAAVDKGSRWYGDAPGQQTRVNNLEALRAWGGTFASYSDATPMDYVNWDALRTQVFGAASDLESLGEVDAAFYQRLSMLWEDVKEGAANVAAVAGIGLGAALAIGLGVLLLAREAKP